MAEERTSEKQFHYVLFLALMGSIGLIMMTIQVVYAYYNDWMFRAYYDAFGEGYAELILIPVLLVLYLYVAYVVIKNRWW